MNDDGATSRGEAPDGPPGLVVDSLTGDPVRLTPARDRRPERPPSCPFCVGGSESPDPYVVRTIPNRWPPLDDDRCEVLLYGPEHDRTLAQLGPERARLVVDTWAERTAVLGRRDDVAYVLPFENHGHEVGATVEHPHGQIFAFETIPPRPARELERLASGAPLLDARYVVIERDGWSAWVPRAPSHPHHVRLAPLVRRPSLDALDDGERDALSSVLVELLGRVEALFDPPMPYMTWWHQAPTDGGRWPHAWLHLDLVSPWRGQGRPRHVAAGELGSGVMFNPVHPAAAAAALRAVSPEPLLRRMRSDTVDRGPSAS